MLRTLRNPDDEAERTGRGQDDRREQNAEGEKTVGKFDHQQYGVGPEAAGGDGQAARFQKAVHAVRQERKHKEDRAGRREGNPELQRQLRVAPRLEQVGLDQSSDHHQRRHAVDRTVFVRQQIGHASVGNRLSDQFTDVGAQ